MAYIVNNVISKGCHGQGQHPLQSTVDSNSGVEPFSCGNVDGVSSPVLMQLQRSSPAFLAEELAETAIFLQSAALEVAMPRRLPIPQVVFSECPSGGWLSRSSDTEEEDGSWGTT